MSNHILTQPARNGQNPTRRAFLASLATLPAAASPAQILALIVGDSTALHYTPDQIAYITAPPQPGEVAHLRAAIAVYEAMAAERRARLAWLENAERAA